MGIDPRKLFQLKKAENKDTLIRISCYIDEDNVNKLDDISAITGKEQSLLVKDAIIDLIKKYKSKTLQGKS